MLKEYSKFVVSFPLELLREGVYISLIRWISSYVLYQNYHENKQCTVINESNNIHTHHWHKEFSFKKFVVHHGEEIAYGLSVVLPLSVLAHVTPSIMKNVVWAFTGLPVNYAVKLASHLTGIKAIEQIFSIDNGWDLAVFPITFVSRLTNHLIGIQEENAIFPINYYEWGHSAFNFYLAFIEPVITIGVHGYCADENYLSFIDEGIKSELALPFKVAVSGIEVINNTIQDNAKIELAIIITPINILASTIEYTSDALQNTYGNYFSLSLSKQHEDYSYNVDEL